ncbi:hypothetical protein [Kitasatospora mediocidica]|uniref:hypothetical protein n=1 Tax=Kitasatospora mediocidica TaxID=58352 RepID=UPI000B026A50|nr:hypothetical protein [Kitasatospora mediocidica]
MASTPADPEPVPSPPPSTTTPTSTPTTTPTPAWWARAAKPARPGLPGTLMLRAALGMGVPLFAGLATGQLGLGVFAGLGAMHATLNDRVEPGRLRRVRIGGALAASSVGMVIGGALQRYQVGTLWAALALIVVGFVSGALSATGPRGSAAGMLLLVSASLGGGMHLADPWWVAGPMMLAGAALVVVLGLPYRWRRPQADPRNRALATVYDALGDLLLALGTARGPPPDGC